MRQSRRSRFGDLIRAAGPSDGRRFLADLWTARGWETTVERRLVVARRGDRTERLAVGSRSRFSPSPSIPAEATVVVALGDPARTRRAAPDDARVLSVDDLYELVRYGLPGGRGDDLVADHFGVRLADLPGDGGVGSRGADGVGGAVVAPLSRSLASLPVAPLVFVALLLAAVVVTAGPAGVPGFGPALGGQQSPALTPTATTTTEPTPTPEPLSVAPGVTTAGVENATRLAAAHRRAASNRSYRWTLGYRESIAGDETGREVEVVLVEAPNVYVSEVERTGRLRAFPRPTASEDAYADGTTRYARRPAEPDGVAARVLDSDVRDGPGRQASRAARYVDWYLSTDETTVTRIERATTAAAEAGPGRARYRIEGRGTDFPRSRGYRVEAVVEEDGFVRSMRVTYETRDGLGVEVWFAYDAVGETTVTRPAWLDRADGSTGGRTVVPATASGSLRDGEQFRDRK
ncbi:hypothetical protein [Haloferax sulfurifontis]|uniref:Uncharacterized protein n=1 Tax=Haloferax sulfurifontis ATCC BAA-897 TaxID=662480 RepID=M0I216_9EURY|nr:hypothetical protein [Haloferax sulfurifontis]ELZ90048.1 hypothetical protein C441_14109 [Haloferax sulfurifontis ATCC BAA-897]